LSFNVKIGLFLLFPILILGQAVVSLPDTSIEQGLLYDLPILIENVTPNDSVLSIQISISWNAASFSMLDVTHTNTLTEAWAEPITNIKADGVQLWLFGSNALSSSGIVCYLRTRVQNDAPIGPASISIDNVYINEGNPAAISKNPEIDILIWDRIPPSQINDLTIIAAGEDFIQIQWSASGDDSTSGKASFLDIRCAKWFLNSTNWESATQIPNPPMPLTSGDKQVFLLDSLRTNRHYFIGVKSIDDRGNISGISNVVDTITWDVTPPKIDLLTDFEGLVLGIGDVYTVRWSATDNVGIKNIELYYSDGSGGWKYISSHEENDGMYDWLVPNSPSQNCQFKITAVDSVDLVSEVVSNGYFRIVPVYPGVLQFDTNISVYDSIDVHFSQSIDPATIADGIHVNSSTRGNLEFRYLSDNERNDVVFYLDRPFTSCDTLSMILGASMITNLFGYGLDGNENGVFEGSPEDDDTLIITVGYACDFDNNDQINFDDLSILTHCWYSKDYRYELGPIEGDLPRITIFPDNLFNIEDAMTFGRMWNWFTAQGMRKITIPENMGNANLTIAQEESTIKISTLPSEGIRIVFSYRPDQMKISRKQDYLAKSDALSFSFDSEMPDSGKVEYVRFSSVDNSENAEFIFNIESKSQEMSSIVVGVEGIDASGQEIFSETITFGIKPIPTEFQLFPNYPNPFNAKTIIRFAVPVESVVTIIIFDLIGNEVNRILLDECSPGYYSKIWDGRDKSGQDLSSGMYFFQLAALSIDQCHYITRKLVLLK